MMIFVNGVTCEMPDDGTCFLTLQVQTRGMENPIPVGDFVMSETTALMIAQAIQDTSRQKQGKRGVLS